MARAHGWRASDGALQVARPHDAPPGGPRAADDRGIWQGAGRGAQGDRLRRGLCALLRRGGAASEWRDPAGAERGQTPAGGEAAHRRGGRHHAVELPQRHDHAQGGPRPRCGVHRRGEACGEHAPLRPGPGGTPRGGGRACGAGQGGHVLQGPVARSGLHLLRGRARAPSLLHGLHRRGQEAPRPVCAHREAPGTRTRRQCPVCDLRRRGPRRRHARAHRL
mmetsp:Transcript_14331/g.38676  ORF Transcript_14331/g.38676 Transcript_14331/m.38676 type:complete len:221 (-) Transcript_14331:707-1369(-)